MPVSGRMGESSERAEYRRIEADRHKSRNPAPHLTILDGPILNNEHTDRAEKSLGLVKALPSWSPIDTWTKPEGHIRTCAYSADGRLYAVAWADGISIYDVTTDDNTLVKTVAVKGCIEIALSPRGTYLLTWVRPVKLEDGSQHNNLQIWTTTTAKEISEDPAESTEKPVMAYAHKAQDNWKLQFTEDERFATRSVTNEVHVLDPAKAFAIVDKLHIDNLTSFSLSPGNNPSIACFIAERKGMPARVSVHSLSTLSVPSIQKSFFKADRGQVKWNASGTSLLFLSSTDHDKTGKSYYGETNLFLFTPALQYDARVTLDKEGGISDFCWNPANGGKEFAVTYGFMPAKTTLFDLRLNVLHDFGAQPRNYISWNPQGRLLAIAGFGNLAGYVDIWDRSTLKKAASFQASNCTEWTWSPDGRLIMASTLSPRLRVDNGVRIYHWSGELIHVDIINELYQAAWRPAPTSQFTFSRSLSPAPAPSETVQAINAKKAGTSNGTDGTAFPKPVATGAYRPPGLRGRETPVIYRREDEGGLPHTPGKSTEKPGIPGMTAPQGQQNGKGRGRTVPGAGPQQDRKGQQQGGQQNNKKNGRSNNASGTASPAQQPEPSAPATNGATAPTTPARPSLSNGISQMDIGSPLTPEDKKRRALQKKLGAIEALKAKRDSGEKLEKTQEKKIEAEAEVKRELAELGE